MVQKRKSWFLVLVIAGLLSCGVEEYSYLPSVTAAGGTVVERDACFTATIRLPASAEINKINNFTHFSIFYRIYIAPQDESGEIQLSASKLSGMNSALYSDYNAIYPSTDVTNNSANNNVKSLLAGRAYYELRLEGADIANGRKNDNSNSSRTVEIEIPPNSGSIPTLKVGNSTYNLLRSKGSNDTLQPLGNKPLPDDPGHPNAYFLNYPELNAGPPAGTNSLRENMDVAGSSSAETRYAFVSLYVAVVGRDSSYNAVFSKPTFISILRLPAPY